MDPTAATTPAGTEIEDVTYDLVSVLYHLLQGAQTCAVYRKDARRHGDAEAEAFFTTVQDHYRHLSSRCRDVLAGRIASKDVVDEASWESFPASDPPSH